MAYLFFVTAILFALPHRSSDDPFITYRYARNLANGLGFVYNPHQRILSTTTPFFTLLLAGIFPFWEKLPAAANLVGSFSLAAGGLSIWLMARRWGSPAVGWVGLLIYPTFPLLIMTIGGEMPLMLALVLGAYAAYAYRRFALCGLFSGLAVLTRLDAILAVVVLLIDVFATVSDLRVRRRQLYRRPQPADSSPESAPAVIPIPIQPRALDSQPRALDSGRGAEGIGSPTAVLSPKSALRAAVIFALLVIPWIGFAWIYFGSPIPVTLLAKQRQGLMLASQKFAPGLITVLQGYWSYLFIWLECLLALIGLPALVGRNEGRLYARRWTLVVGWSGLHFAAYTLLGVSRYPWYYAPLVPGLLVLTGLGTQNLARLAERRSTPLTPAAVTAAIILALSFGQAWFAWREINSVDPRYGLYRAAGQWLQRNTPKNALVGTLEIGVIGYYGARPLVDFAGLLQPEVARQLGPQTTYADAALWTAERFQPQYLVLHRGLFPQLAATYLPQRCQWAGAIPGEPYGAVTSLDIYACSPR